MQSKDVTARVRASVTRLRDAEQRKRALEDELKQCNQSIEDIRHNELPDLMFEANVDKLGIPPSATDPGYEAILAPFYRANIAAGWDPEKRARAFEALTEFGHGDLIKNTIVIQLARGEHALAERITRGLDKLQVNYTIGLAVSHQTLTAWLREQIENEKPIPPLDVIGATVGTVVTLKEVKPK